MSTIQDLIDAHDGPQESLGERVKSLNEFFRKLCPARAAADGGKLPYVVEAERLTG